MLVRLGNSVSTGQTLRLSMNMLGYVLGLSSFLPSISLEYVHQNTNVPCSFH